MQAAMGTRRYADYALRAHENLWSPRSKARRLRLAAESLGDLDVLALQECDLGNLRSGFVHQGNWLAAACSFDHTAFHAARNVAGLASSGLAVLSKFPLLSTAAYRLPSTIPGRGALEAVVDHPEGPFRLLVVHLSLSRAGRGRQLAWIQAWSRESPLPSAVVGDFNAEPSCGDFGALALSYGDAAGDHKSFPSWRPTRGLDHILLSGCQGGPVVSREIAGSDHLAVVRDVWFRADGDSGSRGRGHAPGEG